MIKKIIAVTGSYRGIGFEIVKQLASLGHTVILTSRNQDKGENAVRSLRDIGYSVHYCLLDVTNDISIESFFKYIYSNFTKLDILINNAAVLLKEDKNLVNIDEFIYQTTIATNAEAPLKLSRKLIPLMPPGSKIINVSSSGGSMSGPVGGWSPAYCVSKSYLNAITRHLAYYLKDKVIEVNAFDPGWVKSDMGGA